MTLWPFVKRTELLEERIAELQGELLAVQSQDALKDVPFDVCPECGGESWVRVASIVRAQHDGRRERVSLGGSRLMCTECGSHFNLTADGLTRPRRAPGEAPEAGKPQPRERIPVKMPGGRSL